MGNTHPEYATHDECSHSRDADGDALRSDADMRSAHVGRGKTSLDALIELDNVCVQAGVPRPEWVGDRFCCGIVLVEYMFNANAQERLNPVWFKKEEEGDTWTAIMYY
jgi:hypothetical protein